MVIIYKIKGRQKDKWENIITTPMVDQTFYYFFLGLLIALVAFTFFLLAHYYHKQESKYMQVLKYQQSKRNANFSKGFFLKDPKLEFFYGGNEVKIDAIIGRATITFIEVKLAHPTDKKMCIYKESYISKIGKTLGMKDIEIGFDDFDRNVVLKGSDENFIRRLLSFDIREKVLGITDKFKASINLNDDLLIITFPDLFQDEQSSDELIDFSLKLVDRIEEISKY